ncbi:pyridoxamine 5'-phosphate oxidase family protein [Marinactinospora rubrisoli]|uniref:Pyridoxamine 5'-phosphate oxidase family protein n=1 Tax=Marinactinospora rubrisoli TaxID=2715399 RepID=A0ABW2KGU3_9ACTN
MDAAAQPTPDYPRTTRTTPTRRADRARYDSATVHAILDAEFVCHLGFVADGAPVVLPTLYARVDRRLYLHGSTGSRPMRTIDGERVCVTVTIPDGIVLARAAMHHSVNYRSVVAHGIAHRVTDPAERAVALDALVDQVAPGRSADCRPANAKEHAMTAVLRLDLDEVSAKVRTGAVADEPEDLELPHWAGVIPVRRTLGAPVPDGALAAGTPLPGYLSHRA